MPNYITLPGGRSGAFSPKGAATTVPRIVVLIVVLVFAVGLLAAGLEPAEVAWLTGAIAATAALLAHQLGFRG
ncbi:hypothetical protein [Glycomyces tenuis]|uniref:hypothetical protein n=1 Tax=Glycomyces tenuis TaxID=58116 RepID=UPI00047DA075|nr:hypothetical protein [Glycomyces tenuis]